MKRSLEAGPPATSDVVVTGDEHEDKVTNVAMRDAPPIGRITWYTLERQALESQQLTAQHTSSVNVDMVIASPVTKEGSFSAPIRNNEALNNEASTLKEVVELDGDDDDTADEENNDDNDDDDEDDDEGDEENSIGEFVAVSSAPSCESIIKHKLMDEGLLTHWEGKH